MNDPREILKAAGVEVPEVEAYERDRGKRGITSTLPLAWNRIDCAEIAIIALARLFAEEHHYFAALWLAAVQYRNSQRAQVDDDSFDRLLEAIDAYYPIPAYGAAEHEADHE